MRSAPAPSGTLEEGQVRAMFDRIAGFYDVMNSVMTAGLHHRWRERAADVARVRPGKPGARRRHRHRGPGARAGAARAPGRRGDRLGLLGGDARAGAHEGRRRARRDLGVGQRARAALPRRLLRRRHGRLRRAELLGPRARPGRDGARGAPGRARGRARDHDADEAAALHVLLALVRPRRADARALRRRPRGLHVPAQVREALPRARGAGRRAVARRAQRRALDPDRGRDHRHPLRHGGV